jgi:predicted metalloendopeptidase
MENNKAEPLLPGLEKYSPEQLFFINYGQLWCGKYRNESLYATILNDVHAPGDIRFI